MDMYMHNLDHRRRARLPSGQDYYCAEPALGGGRCTEVAEDHDRKPNCPLHQVPMKLKK